MGYSALPAEFNTYGVQGEVEHCVGLDRMDSSKGYFEKNVVPCCAACNTMKLHFGLEAWLEKCADIELHTSCVSTVRI